MSQNLKLYATKAVQYQDHKVFYAITENGDVPPELYGHPDDNGDECLIKIVPILDLASIDEYVKRNDLIEVEVFGIEDFYSPSPASKVRWFAERSPVEVATTSKRKTLLGHTIGQTRQTFVQKNVRFPIELFKRLELFTEQNELHVSDAIATALQEYLSR